MSRPLKGSPTARAAGDRDPNTDTEALETMVNLVKGAFRPWLPFHSTQHVRTDSVTPVTYNTQGGVYKSQ